MFIFKRKPTQVSENLDVMKKFIAQTLESMLETREETIHFMEKYDLILIFSWEDEYIEGSIYQYSTYIKAKEGIGRLQNAPLYIEKRFLDKEDKTVVYVDDNRIRNFTAKNLRAFYCMCELISIFEIEVTSSNKYKCVWQ
ncbi:hypothetical protein [Planococcus sp. YIM B11945]|uniref:hypothetical protein n=1 Tax=Planococcus sp. YIM B11945 TaxID=3435410 RepID=UPI003D7C9D48